MMDALDHVKSLLNNIKIDHEIELKACKDQVLKAEKLNVSYISALHACRSMLEQALPYLEGKPEEKDFRVYLNIVSDVLGDLEAYDFSKVFRTPKEQGEWIEEQLNKRNY